MTTAQTISLRTFTDLAPARDDLIAVYSDVRAELLHLPNYAVPAFTERLDRHGGDPPGWFAVLAYTEAGGEPIGYVYGNVIESADRWWKRIKPTPARPVHRPPGHSVKELGVRVPWRKTGTAKRLHDTLLAAHTAQPYATLMVNPAAGDGKVQRLYESWGLLEHRRQPSLSGLSDPDGDDPSDGGRSGLTFLNRHRRICGCTGPPGSQAHYRKAPLIPVLLEVAAALGPWDFSGTFCAVHEASQGLSAA